MVPLLFIVIFLGIFVFLFFREVKLDHKRYLEADRLADEHILREIEQYLKEKGYHDR